MMDFLRKGLIGDEPEVYDASLAISQFDNCKTAVGRQNQAIIS